MTSTVADPEWGWWIIWYFFLGGIAAGAYFLAALADLIVSGPNRRVARAGYLLAAPLVAICGLLLIVDLNQPWRFWHMFFDADTARLHLKIWSPMSIGAWALLLFSLISTVSFLGTCVEIRSARWRPLAMRLYRGKVGRAFAIVGSTAGFFIASYTGALLSASNQPVWSDSPWLGALFLASAAGTGAAAIKLALALPASRWLRIGSDEMSGSDPEAHEAMSADTMLESFEPWVWILEVCVAGLFLASLDKTLVWRLATAPAGWIFLAGLLGLGVGVPALLRFRPRMFGPATVRVSAVAVLLAGLLVRYSIVTAPTGLLYTSAKTSIPTEGRQRVPSPLWKIHRELMTLPSNPPHPRQLAVLLLASGESLPRQRARDQQADVTGSELKQRVLQRLIELDPDPAELLGALEQIIIEIGEPTGPTRAIARIIGDDFAALCNNPRLAEWLVASAVHEQSEASSGQNSRRRRNRSM